MSKILVTGGAGFIGSAVIEHLQKSDHQIYVIDNLSFGNRQFIDLSEGHFFSEDILNKKRILEIITKIKPDSIIHLAAIHFIPYCNAHPFQSSNINIQGTLNVLHAAKQANVKQVFFASAAAVYPIYDGPLSETHETGPMDIYGLSKLVCENLCHEFFLETNINTIICRFFNAFGPHETNPHLIPEIYKQVREGKRTIQLGNLTPKRDYLHTSDIAVALQLLIENHKEGYHTYNLGSGTEYSVHEIIDAFEKQIGEKLTIEIDAERVRKTERLHLLADISKLRNLGWKPLIGLDEGISTLMINDKVTYL